MTVEELRIGNLLRDKVSKTELKVKSLIDDQITTYVIDREMFPLQDGWGIEPIPLTEEWLVKFGFEKGKGRDGLTEYSKSIRLVISNSKNIYYSQNKNAIKHVHQLQNLYFALTGKELTIKK